VKKIVIITDIAEMGNAIVYLDTQEIFVLNIIMEIAIIKYVLMIVTTKEIAFMDNVYVTKIMEETIVVLVSL
jgi:hypothetical protein